MVIVGLGDGSSFPILWFFCMIKNLQCKKTLKKKKGPGNARVLALNLYRTVGRAHVSEFGVPVESLSTGVRARWQSWLYHFLAG